LVVGFFLMMTVAARAATVSLTWSYDYMGLTVCSATAGTNCLDHFEVRWSDAGWSAGNSRNLVGRFSTQTFTLPRLSRAQTVFLQQYDASTPAKYSRYSAALHIDFPF